jgi:hypothetical protein
LDQISLIPRGSGGGLEYLYHPDPGRGPFLRDRIRHPFRWQQEHPGRRQPPHDNPREWTLKADIVVGENPHSLIYSLLHEYGHLLTLNASQVPPVGWMFYHPDDKTIYENAVNNCPQYFTGEGCSNPGSYIDEFFHHTGAASMQTSS